MGPLHVPSGRDGAARAGDAGLPDASPARTRGTAVLDLLAAAMRLTRLMPSMYFWDQLH